MRRPPPLPTIEEVRELAAQFAASFESVQVVYAFGSLVRGRTKPESDVDLALWVDPCSNRDRFDLRLDAMGWFMNHLRRDNVDLIILNDAPPVLQYNAVCRGQLLYERKPGLSWQCWRRALNMYWDAKPMLDRSTKRVLATLREWRRDG